MDFNLIMWSLGISFVVSIIAGPLFIPILRRLKFGQQIRTDGPKAHMKKKGTPTMGGTIILLAMAIAFLRYGDHQSPEFFVLIVASLGFGLVGFLDDYIKIVLKRSLGLTARQKLFGQFIVAIVICIFLIQMGHSTDIHIPLTDLYIPLGWFYYAFITLFMLGISNAVNFTDGLDGLLAGTGAIAFGAFAVIAMMMTEVNTAIFTVAMIGAVLGFLVFNAHPAKVFMGDTGSLGIGGAIAAIAILTKTEILFLVIGGIFVIEVMSVILQVISFKTTGKRIFKMSPIHHHFELSGWSEWRVVITFWAVGLVLAAAGLLMYKGL